MILRKLNFEVDRVVVDNRGLLEYKVRLIHSLGRLRWAVDRKVFFLLGGG